MIRYIYVCSEADAMARLIYRTAQKWQKYKLETE